MSWWHWCVHTMGVDFQVRYGHWIWYSFWSGFFGGLSIFAGFSVFAWHSTVYYRANNCVVHRCPRIGKFSTAAGHKTCRKHHPAIDAPLTAEAVTIAHEQAANGCNCG